MTVSRRQRDLDEVRGGLVRWFHTSRPEARELEVAPLQRGATGFSSETLFVDVRWRHGRRVDEEHLVARLPPAGGGIFPSYDLARQARVQAALNGTVIPVPRPVAVETDSSWIGTPFLLMERASGFTLPDSPSYVSAGRLFDAPPSVQASVQRDFLQALAGVHRLPWEELGLGDLTPAPERGVAHDLARAEEYLAWAADGDVPGILAEAISWCRAHVPCPEPPPSLLWGDPRLGNVVFDDRFAQVALLDWEMASLGPAELDLSWFVSLHEGSAGAHGSDLPGFDGREAMIATYQELLGRELDRSPWFEVLSLVRADSIFLRIRRMLLAAGGTEPWLRGNTPAQARIADLMRATP